MQIFKTSKLNFKLDTKNARFLDLSWQIPDTYSTLFVPCSSLGLVITFCGELAVVADLEKGSVASEDDKIEPGDVLDELNDQVVTVEQRGNLKNILSKCRNQPITIRVVKTHCSRPEETYPPCLSIYPKYDATANLCAKKDGDDDNIKTKGGNIFYLGNCNMGRKGDVTQVEVGIRKVAATNQERRPVHIECRELDVIVSSEGKLLMKHPYTSIASCGQSLNYSKYFAFLVGNGPCSSSTDYTCHVFTAISDKICDTVLLGLGSGFERTHCAA